MKKATITIQAEDDIALYRVVNHLSFNKEVEILEAKVDEKKYTFDKEGKNVRYFLRDDFSSIIKEKTR